MGAVRWAATTWTVDGSRIRFRRGWLSVKEVEVPLSRVQSLDLEQGPVQRLFGVQAVQVQTGGGGAGGEIVLDALAPADIERLRELVAHRRPEPLPETRQDLPERRLSRRMLLVAALTSGQIGVILPVLAGLSQAFDDLVRDPVQGEQTAERLLPDTALEWALAAGGLLVLAWLLAAVGAVVAFSGFSARRDGDVLRVRRGLLARRDVTLPVARVRAVRVVEGVLRQPFGLATAARGGDRLCEGARRRPHALPAAAPPRRPARCSPRCCPSSPTSRRAWPRRPPARTAATSSRPPPRRSRPAPRPRSRSPRRGRWPRSSPASPTASCAGAPPAGGWPAAGSRSPPAALSRTTVLAPAANGESHDLAQTELQRRARLADVAVAFGKSTTARIRHLDEATARDLWAAIR